MKKLYIPALIAAVFALEAPALAQSVPTGNMPVGTPKASPAIRGSSSGNTVELREHVPVQAETTGGQQGWLKMDGHGAYWFGRDVDADGRLVSAVSAPQGVYKIAGGKSVVVK